MQVSRIARTHLIYQFIIMALLFVCIGYYEFLLDKKFIFILALGAVFFYQLTTLSCYTELLPFTQFLILKEVLFGTSDSRTENKMKEQSPTRITEHKDSKECPVEYFSYKHAKDTSGASLKTSNHENHTPKQRTYKFRDWQTRCFSTTNKSDFSLGTCTASNTSSLKKSQKFTLSNVENLVRDSELTKTYFFPYRQKRLEEWIDSKGNARPYKIRSRVPNIEEYVDLDNQMTSKGSTTEMPQHAEVPTIDETELRKSYSFPFRRKKCHQWGEPAEYSEMSNTLSTPYRHIGEDSVSAKQKVGRRRSVSISSLNNQRLNIINNRGHGGFTQSLEISDTSHAMYSASKKSSTKASNANFNKIKKGILNCFSRMKKENLGLNLNSKETDSNSRFLKTSYQSRESLQFLDSDNDYISLKTRGESKVNSHFYPEYAPFVKRSFLMM